MCAITTELHKGESVHGYSEPYSYATTALVTTGSDGNANLLWKLLGLRVVMDAKALKALDLVGGWVLRERNGCLSSAIPPSFGGGAWSGIRSRARFMLTVSTYPVTRVVMK